MPSLLVVNARRQNPEFLFFLRVLFFCDRDALINTKYEIRLKMIHAFSNYSASKWRGFTYPMC